MQSKCPWCDGCEAGGWGSCHVCGFSFDDCTKPNREACPRLCQEFCNKAEEAKSELPSSTGTQRMLGAVERTSRGFEFIEFKDHYGDECSLQVSSLAIYEKPGTSAVWLGKEAEKLHPQTGAKLGARMHLNREQVVALIKHLQSWLDNDTFTPIT